MPRKPIRLFPNIAFSEREREALVNPGTDEVIPGPLLPEADENDMRMTDFYIADRYAERSDGVSFYAKDFDGNEFPLVKDGKAIYAAEKRILDGKENVVQFPMRSKDGQRLYIHDEMGIVYPWDLTNDRPAFPLDENLNETYITDNVVEHPQYPIDAQGKAHYARDVNRNEILIPTENGMMYAKGLDGVEVYPKKANGDEFAITNANGRQYYAMDQNDNQRYPKTANGDEFALFDETGVAHYAVNNQNVEQYPKKANGMEFYIASDGVDRGALDMNAVAYYAKDSEGNEYYPKKPLPDFLYE